MNVDSASSSSAIDCSTVKKIAGITAADVTPSSFRIIPSFNNWFASFKFNSKFKIPIQLIVVVTV